MPLPTPGQVKVSIPLTNMSIAHVQTEDKFQAGSVVAEIPVKSSTGKYFKWSKGDLNRDEVQPRSPGRESAGSDLGVAQEDFATQRWAFHKDMDDETADAFMTPLDAERSAVTNVTNKHLIKREVQMSAVLMATGVWGNTDQTGVAAAPGANQFLQFNDPASTPIEFIQGRIVAVHTNCTMLPNTILTGLEVSNKLKRHAQFLDIIKYTQMGIVTEELMAKAIGVETFKVSTAVRNTATKGQTATMAQIVGKSMLLMYRTPSPAIDQVSAAYCFSYSKYDRVRGGAAAIKKFRMEHLDSWRYEGEQHFVYKITSSDAGQLFVSVIA